MPLVKILKDYKSSENYRVGQMVDITNPWTLIKQGLVILVDDEGHEIDHPDILMQIKKSVTTDEAIDLIGQIIDKNPNKEAILKALKSAGAITVKPAGTITPVAATTETPLPQTPDQIKAKVDEIKRKEAVVSAMKVR